MLLLKRDKTFPIIAILMCLGIVAMMIWNYLADKALAEASASV